MAPLRVSEAFVDHVARSQRKLIVTLTSGMGSLADNTSGGSIAYRSSKAAVNMVMRVRKGLPVYNTDGVNRGASSWDLTNVVLVAQNQLPYTSIPSMNRYTRELAWTHRILEDAELRAIWKATDSGGDWQVASLLPFTQQDPDIKWERDTRPAKIQP
jgi:NAD(P)-dependent dehydrogenase (short-subunit alcohol dehydrogenase family)